MLEIIKYKKFSKNLKKLKYKKKVLDELEIALSFLRAKKELPKKYKDHQLKGKFAGIRELHLGYDDLLLYFIVDEQKQLVLVDIGSHSKTLNI